MNDEMQEGIPREWVMHLLDLERLHVCVSMFLHCKEAFRPGEWDEQAVLDRMRELTQRIEPIS